MVQNAATPTSDARTPLDLTPSPDDIVALDGERYELKRLASFGLRRNARCRKIWDRLGALEQIAEPSEDDEREYRKLALEVAGYALPDAPPELLAKFDNEQLGDLVVTFFTRGALRSRRLTEVRRAVSSAGAVLSPGSSASTVAATSGGGST